MIATLTPRTTPATGDRVIVSTVTTNVSNSMLLSDFMKIINFLTDKATPIGGDLIAIYDSVGAIAGKLSLTNLVAYLKTAISPDTLATNTDITTNNSSTGFHGFLKKLSGNAYDIMTGDGNWTTMDGWIPAGITWTYASATTFTTTGNTTAIFTKGTRITLTQTTAKYFTVVSSAFGASTTVTITGGSDYTLANAAITLPFYSYQLSPQGYPVTFNWTPGYTGFSADPAGNLAKFYTIGSRAHVSYGCALAGVGTPNATTFTITGLPITAATSRLGFQMATYRDNSANSTTPGRLNLATATVSCFTDANVGVWTASGTKAVYSFDVEYDF